MKTVHVVEWEYNTGGGFDWYHTKEAADEAFIEEQENCIEFKEENWTAKQFEHQTNLTDNNEITDEIIRRVHG